MLTPLDEVAYWEELATSDAGAGSPVQPAAQQVRRIWLLLLHAHLAFFAENIILCYFCIHSWHPFAQTALFALIACTPCILDARTK